ncbi:helix-turn-helix domain-containing protein [Streptomyces sp. NPDC001890]|uniref:helix-turn-helix domain-containing protein n=1 Tax=Streptomyces sp. NPDC001890 TaxID=3364620 RepID=UPI003694786E
MDAAPDASQANDLAAAVASIDELLALLGRDRDLIDIGDISHRTGIPVGRVTKLLDGVEPQTAEDPQTIFKNRLVFLHETRLKQDRKKYTLDEIAAGTGISHSTVSNMLNGLRTPKVPVVASLERFFGVAPGFFTASEGQALLRALQPVHDQLTHLALLKGKGITQVAMRSSAAGGDSGRIGHELREALTAALNQPRRDYEDPEVRELTDRMLSLPSRKRRKVISLVWDLLKFMRSEGEPPVSDPSARP